MHTSHSPIIRVWKWWFTTRSTDPTVMHRERALRFLLPVFTPLRVLAIINAYSITTTAPPRYFPVWVPILVTVVPFLISFYCLSKGRVGWSGAVFLLNWYLMDMLNLPADGYWFPGFQISLVLQIVLASLLLPTRAIIPFWAAQVVTVGLWGSWLDMNVFDPPLLDSGRPVAVFSRTMITLAVQEAIIMFIVRYLRLEMEKSLRQQQSVIAQLKDEMKHRYFLQDEREQYIDELNKKNAELERFTYTVSHDLRNPLVTIKGFIGMLGRDIQDQKPERIQHDMERIAGATDKMDALLSELLELSRIGRVVNPPEEVGCAQLVQDALELLDARIRSSNIKVLVADDLPVLYGDRIRLLEVFENLIDNAIKYMGSQPEPVIEIGVRDTAGQQVIFVKDNGIGIDERYHTRVFGLFEKLDPTVEGTGIGLALIKRIVETHGGWVWVESKGLGEGSTFCFTIPDGKDKK